MKTARLVVLALAPCWLVAELAFAQEVVEQPTWSVGDWWEIGVYRMTVSARDKDLYEMIRTRAGKTPEQSDAKPYKLYMTADGWISKRIEPDGTVAETGEDARYEWIRFLLNLEKGWTFGVLGKGRRSKGGSNRYEFQCRADKWDELSVAGRYVRSLRIECQSGTREGPLPPRTFRHTVWYAPEAKRYIRLVSHYVGGPTLECSAWSVRP